MRIAAIDVGSNSVHIIVCRIRPDLSFEVIDRERDMIRLGAGSLARHALAPEAIGLAMQTLTKFKRLAESHGVDEIVTAATSAVREADNGGDFDTRTHALARGVPRWMRARTMPAARPSAARQPPASGTGV